MNTLKILYLTSVQEKLKKQFGYLNVHQIPKIKKVVLTYGLGVKGSQNKAFFQKCVEDIRNISGQHPITLTSKKSIAGFKIREGMPIGLMVTLRKEKMYAFLERLIKLALPRTRDFRGLKKESFDTYGNYSLGISDQFVFPELQDDMLDQKRGFNITIVTTAKSINESYFLLKELGFPFS